MGRFAFSALLVAVVASFFFTGSVRAQTGEIQVDPEEVLRLGEWQAEPRGEMESIVVDHRHRMPPVRAQSLGDCSAWAYGYAAKSYHEVIDQGWKADAPQRTFSPAFIYNSLNGGKDQGLHPLNTLTFLIDHGCATLRTMPYRPGDYTTKPSQAAINEAKLFRIADAKLLKTGADVRLALQQGHVVPVSVRTNPIFNSGNYPIYTTGHHSRGTVLRKDGGKHGLHAMAIVGYDDKKGAFLLMNSWGTDWGQKGYCWVAYEVFKKFNYIEKIESELINFAVVLLDRKEKVELNPDGSYRSATPDKTSLVIQSNGEYRGFDSASRKHQYFFAAAISGQLGAIDLIESVHWVATIDGKVTTAISNNRLGYFRFSNTLASNVVPLSAVITFKDKTTRSLRTELRLPAPSAQHRQIELAMQDWYHGKWLVNGVRTSAWDWRVEVTGNLTDLNDIDKVTFNVGNMNRLERTVTHQADAYRAYHGADRNIGHGGITIAANLNVITANVIFKDGSKKDLTLNPLAFKSTADDTLALESSFHEDGSDGFDTWYTWNVRFKSPRDICNSIDHILYELGPTQADRKVRVSDLYGGFNVSGAARREFRVYATVHFKDGKKPLKLEHWVSLGRNGKYADPRRIEINTTDVYRGIDSQKRPLWRVTMMPLGDPVTLATIEKVKYEFPEGYRPREVEVLAAEHAGCPLDVTTTKPLSMMATVHYKDGNFTRFPVEVKPRSARDDRFAFTLHTARYKESPPTWRSVFYGPQTELRRISSVDYRFTENGYRKRLIVDPGYHNQGAIYTLQATITDDSYVHAIVTFNDGSQQFGDWYVSKDNAGFWPGLLPWSAQLRERFEGYKDGIPQWRVNLAAIGTPESLATIQGMRYAWTDDDNKPQRLEFQPVTDQALLANGTIFEHETLVSMPTTFTVSAKLHGHWIDVPRHALTTAPRTKEPIVMRQARYTTGPATGGGTNYHWFVYIDGWERKLRDIKQVEYQLPRALGGQKVAVTDRFAHEHGGFAYLGVSQSPATIDAVVTFNDGTTQKLYIQTGLPKEPASVVMSDRYWGINEKKEPTWLVSYHLTGDYWDHLHKVWAVEWMHDAGKLGKSRVTGKPLFEDSIMVSKPVLLDHGYAAYEGEPWRKHEVKERLPMKSPRTEFLGLRQAAGVTPIKPGSTTNEWITHIVGPEMLMRNVKKVTYTIDLPAGLRTITTENRWGETRDGFELRYFDDMQLPVEAVIEFQSGGKMTLIHKGQ